jgi:hypothetical protein
MLPLTCVSKCHGSQFAAIAPSHPMGTEARLPESMLTSRPLKRMPNTMVLVSSFSFRLATVSSFLWRVMAFVT